MTVGRLRRLTTAMLREEWRLHARLFGGWRFGAFPLLIAVLAVATTVLLMHTGTDGQSVIAGLHVLVVIFGVHTASIGLIGRDAMDDLLGEVTLLVFSGRTLPLSGRHLLGAFVVKDVIYYGVLFLVPLTVGAGPAVADAVSPSPPALLGWLALLWATLVASFLLGACLSLVLLGSIGRGIARGAIAVAVVAGAAVGWYLGVDPVPVTPYGVFETPTVTRALAATVALATAVVLAGVVFEVRRGPTARTRRPRVRAWNARVGDPLATKGLLDVHRGSGGFGKVLFSAAVLLLVAAGLVVFAERLTGLASSAGVAFGTVLGLTGFTTYNWLTQSVDATTYRHLPLGTDDVLRGIWRAYRLLAPPVAVVGLAVAMAWQRPPVTDALLGVVLALGVVTYVFGVTALLAGLSPNEFLFDTPLFLLFTLAMVVPLVPVLVVGFALAPLDGPAVGALALAGVALAIVGLALTRVATRRWRSFDPYA